ncbi:MAG: LytR/AlgR family response regulator transcription factor [Anaerovoracaceae bacterium]|jgi:DNA-binding LytR/AlgR family response regulator
MLNIAIVYDRKDDREELSNILRAYAATVGEKLSIKHFESAETLLDNYQPFLYTIIFLDIYMSGMTGMQAAEAIRETDGDTILIFLTTSKEHRADALHNHAFDYLEKPTDRAQVFRIMDDILRRKTSLEDSLTFSMNRIPYTICYRDIMAVSSSSHSVLIYDKEGREYRPRLSFTGISEELLKDRRFLPIIRGVIVNMDFIQDFRNGVCFLERKMEFPCNLRKEKQLIQTWQNYNFQKLRNEAGKRRRG